MANHSETNKSGFATAGLVLGIIGMCTSFIPIVNNLSFVIALIGISFGIVSLLKKASKGQAIAGIIICVLAIVITINSQQALSDSFETISDDLDTFEKLIQKVNELEIPFYTDNYFVKKAEIELDKILNR